MKQKLKINLEEFHYTCGDGCCDMWGTIVTVNGIELPNREDDPGFILKSVLEHLGYDVEITQSEEGEVFAFF